MFILLAIVTCFIGNLTFKAWHMFRMRPMMPVAHFKTSIYVTPPAISAEVK
jgi:hypothetical protein